MSTQVSTERLEAITSTVLQPTAANGVQGRTGVFEDVIAGLTAVITRNRPEGTEVLRFPPVMSRALLEKSGYLKSFPHLLGCVSSMTGTETKIRALVEGKAVNQVEQALKFELLRPVNSDEAPTACMSFHYHQDHFGTTWGLRTDDGGVAHTACAAFGLDRLTIALFATHGLDLETWPAEVRETLSL